MSFSKRIRSLFGSNRFARNFGWQLIANILQIAFAGTLMICLGLFLDPADFGIYSLIGAIVAVTGQLFETRAQDIASNQLWNLSNDEAPLSAFTLLQLNRKIRAIFMLEFVSRLLPTLALIALSQFALQHYSLDSQHTKSLVIAAMGFLGSKFSWGVTNGTLRILGRTDILAKVLALDWGFRLFAVVVLFYSKHLSIFSILVASAIIGALFNIFQLIYTELELKKKNLSLMSWQDLTFASVKQELLTCKKLIASNIGISISDLMAKDLDVTIAASYVSMAQLGFYKFSKNLVQVLWRLIDPVYLAVMPEIQLLWKSEKRLELKKFIHKISIVLLGSTISLVTLGFVTLKIFEAFFAPAHFAGIAFFVFTLCTWIVICAPLVWAHPLLIAIHRPEISVLSNIVASLLGYFVLVLLTPRWGIAGVGAGWVCTLSIGFVTTAFFSYRMAFSGDRRSED